MPYFFAAASSRWRAFSRAASFSNEVWSNRDNAFRTCDASWIGRRRRPFASMYANALAGSLALAVALSDGIVRLFAFRPGAGPVTAPVNGSRVAELPPLAGHGST